MRRRSRKRGRRIRGGGRVLGAKMAQRRRAQVILICSDSLAALQTIQSCKSKIRPDILSEIMIVICNIHKIGCSMEFMGSQPTLEYREMSQQRKQLREHDDTAT